MFFCYAHHLLQFGYGLFLLGLLTGLGIPFLRIREWGFRAI